MSSTGGRGRQSELPDLISQKRESSYSMVATWIRWKIIFPLIKSIGTCLRGSRSIFHEEKLWQPIKDDELLTSNSSRFRILSYQSILYIVIYCKLMTTAACNLQRISKLLRINLFFSSNVNTSILTYEFPYN